MQMRVEGCLSFTAVHLVFKPCVFSCVNPRVEATKGSGFEVVLINKADHAITLVRTCHVWFVRNLQLQFFFPPAPVGAMNDRTRRPVAKRLPFHPAFGETDDEEV